MEVFLSICDDRGITEEILAMKGKQGKTFIPFPLCLFTPFPASLESLHFQRDFSAKRYKERGESSHGEDQEYGRRWTFTASLNMT